MHIAVSWDIAGNENRNEITEALQQILKPYGWHRPLSTFYIIPIDAFGRDAVVNGLTSICNRYPGRIRFVVTPLMQGHYQGMLAPSDWQAINERTP